MECGRAGKHPLNAICNVLVLSGSPRVVGAFRSVRQSQIHDIEEVLKTKPAQIASVTTYDIPPQEPIGVVQVAARHSREALEVLRKEGLVYPQKEEHEMGNSMVFWVLTPSLFTYPKVECGKDTENSPHTQYVVEVRYYVVSVVQRNVNPPVRKNNTS